MKKLVALIALIASILLLFAGPREEAFPPPEKKEAPKIEENKPWPEGLEMMVLYYKCKSVIFYKDGQSHEWAETGCRK